MSLNFSSTWYYSVKGKISLPLTWDELCEAVKSRKVGPDDLVWTKAFGNEWRKASTLEALFESINESVPKQNNDSANQNDATSIEGLNGDSKKAVLVVEAEGETLKQEEIDNSSKENDYNSYQQYYYPRRVSVIGAFKSAYGRMVDILFSSFDIMRWIPLAVAFFLASQLSIDFSSNMLEREDKSPEGTKQQFQQISNQLQLPADFFDTGVFSSQFKGYVAELNEIVEKTTPSPDKKTSKEQLDDAHKMISIYEKMLNDFGITCKKLFSWMCTRYGIIIVISFFLFFFLLKVACTWFGSRGKFIAMSRCYSPNVPFAVSWRSVASPANRFFRMMVCYEFISTLFSFASCIYVIRYIAYRSGTTALSINGVFLVLSIIVLICCVISLVGSYLRNFVALPILLEKGRLTLKYIFKGFGFWILRFGIIYFLCFQFLYFFLGLDFIQMLMFFPIIRELFCLPFYLFKLLWTMDITIQMRPELEKLRPPMDPWGMNR